MNLVDVTQIASPKITVSPPFWAMALFWIVSVAVLAVLGYLPVVDGIKYVLIGIYGLVLLGLLRNQLKGGFLTTMQANKDGLYFQTSKASQYVHVPWNNVGLMEKTMFPLNKRGLRVEIIGGLVEQIRRSKDIGNVFHEDGRTYIYTLPQLRDRDELIEQFETFRAGR